MANRAELAIDIVSDGSDAAAAADKVAASYSDMGTAVDRASRMADDGADRLGHTADAADNLASKSSQATGGLGALSAGFELVGAEKYAVGLQSAAMATDFFSGVGDIANLVLESQAVQTIKNTALKIKDAVVTRAQAVATAAMTAAQWALNAAMNANPLALVIIALVALTAALVIAYKKSDTFRKIVDAAFRAVAKVVRLVVDAVVGTVQRLVDSAVRLFTRLRDGVTRAVGAILSWVRDHWRTLLVIFTGPIGLVYLAVQRWGGNVRDFIANMVDRVKSSVRDGFNALVGLVSGPVERARQAVVDKFGRVLDYVGDLPGKILHELGDLGHLLYDAGVDIIQGLIDGLWDKVEDLRGVLSKVTDLVPDWKGPRERDRVLLRDAGQLIIQGLVDGIDASTPKVKDKLGQLTATIRDGVKASTADPLDLNVSSGSLARAGSVTNVYVTMPGLVTDPVGTAAQLRDLLTRSSSWTPSALVQP